MCSTGSDPMTILGLCLCQDEDCRTGSPKLESFVVYGEPAKLCPNWGPRILQNNVMRENILHVWNPEISQSPYRTGDCPSLTIAKALFHLCKEHRNYTGLEKDLSFYDLNDANQYWKEMIREPPSETFLNMLWDVMENEYEREPYFNHTATLEFCFENNVTIPESVLRLFPLKALFRLPVKDKRRFNNLSHRGREIIRWDTCRNGLDSCSKDQMFEFGPEMVRILKKIPLDDEITICGPFAQCLSNDVLPRTRSRCTNWFDFNVDIFICCPDPFRRNENVRKVLTALRSESIGTMFVHVNQFKNLMTIVRPDISWKFRIRVSDSSVGELLNSFDMDCEQVGIDGSGWFSTLNSLIAIESKIVCQLEKVVPVKVARALVSGFKFQENVVERHDMNPLLKTVLNNEDVRSELYRCWNATQNDSLSRAITVMTILYGPGTVQEISVIDRMDFDHLFPI